MTAEVPLPRGRRALRLLRVRRTRPKDLGPAQSAPHTEAGPGAPDVWLAGLRLGS
ncbi:MULTISPECIES: hypothetical protein [unclassified Streptomyces]|jgi:hypothetical protein|uniref:hypothetical protein n=1 Tax=unclassified Streptomyces TaxID=2593676 RepID=UPI002E258B4E